MRDMLPIIHHSHCRIHHFDSDDLLHLLRVALQDALAGRRRRVVLRQGAERLSVRHVPNGLRRGDGASDLARLRRSRHRVPPTPERRAGDSRRGAAGAPRQARHADDGRRAHHRLGRHLDAAVGAAVEPVRLDHPRGDDGLRLHRLHGRLPEGREEAEPRADGPKEVDRSTTDRARRVGRALRLHAAGLGRLLLEALAPVLQGDGALAHHGHRPRRLPAVHRNRSARILERGELDGRA